MKLYRYILSVLAVGSSLLCGCSDSLSVSDAAREEVEVCLNLNMASAVSDRHETKLGFVDPSKENFEINNLWVLQFDGTTDGSKLLAARYYPEYAAGTRVRLFTSSTDNYILLVANSNNPSAEFAKCRILDDVKKIGTRILDVTWVAGKNASGGYDMLMNGHALATVTSSMPPLDVTLRYNAARLDVKVTNTSSGQSEPVTIDSVGITVGVPYMFYYTDYTLPEIYPEKVSHYPVLKYSATSWNDGTADGDSRRFTFYVPANKRGVADISDPKEKILRAPDKSTYLEVWGADSESRRLHYRFCLGANLTSDYNILPGMDYSYDIEISSAGDWTSDSRVENLYMQDFTDAPLANSYMINPPSVAGVWKTVRIPVKRVHDFWNITDGYEKVNNNALEQGSYGWRAEIIRSTVELVEDVNFKWVTREGNDYRDYFEFAISSEVNGNFVIGIHRFGDRNHTILDDVFLWSWHMWVTDYDPDATIRLLSPEYDASGNESRFVYEVSGGQVNRYPGNVWKSDGALAGMFMMDRNLGALSVTEAVGPGSLYYQFGRKDPFPYESSLGSIWGGVSLYNCYNTESVYPFRNLNQLTETNSRNDLVVYSVYHPEILITASGSAGWCIDDTNSDGVAYAVRYGNWYDTKLGTATSRKSIFDPCPAGWRVPPANSISFPTGTESTTDVHRIVNNVLPSGELIRFPYVGSISNKTHQDRSWTVWSNQFNLNGNALLASGGSAGGAICYPVRCVSYDEN